MKPQRLEPWDVQRALFLRHSEGMPVADIAVKLKSNFAVIAEILATYQQGEHVQEVREASAAQAAWRKAYKAAKKE